MIYNVGICLPKIQFCSLNIIYLRRLVESFKLKLGWFFPVQHEEELAKKAKEEEERKQIEEEERLRLMEKGLLTEPDKDDEGVILL